MYASQQRSTQALPALDEHSLVSRNNGLHNLSLNQNLAIMHYNGGSLQQQQQQT
jgi:hypothetical protein